MAKDDYFVIVYKILTYLYACLKVSEEPDIENVLNEQTYNIPRNYFEYIIIELYEAGYIDGVTTGNVLGNTRKMVKITKSIQIKPKGIEYLQDNSMLAKAKNVIKDLKDFIPGL